jgi:redox-regulated HSP33 family molecular chaperone
MKNKHTNLINEIEMNKPKVDEGDLQILMTGKKNYSRIYTSDNRNLWNEIIDESTYTKPDYTVLIGMIVMVVLCGIILTVTNVLSVMY